MSVFIFMSLVNRNDLITYEKTFSHFLIKLCFSGSQMFIHNPLPPGPLLEFFWVCYIDVVVRVLHYKPGSCKFESGWWLCLLNSFPYWDTPNPIIHIYFGCLHITLTKLHFYFIICTEIFVHLQFTLFSSSVEFDDVTNPLLVSFIHMYN